MTSPFDYEEVDPITLKPVGPATQTLPRPFEYEEVDPDNLPPLEPEKPFTPVPGSLLDPDYKLGFEIKTSPLGGAVAQQAQPETPQLSRKEAAAQRPASVARRLQDAIESYTDRTEQTKDSLGPQAEHLGRYVLERTPYVGSLLIEVPELAAVLRSSKRLGKYAQGDKYVNEIDGYDYDKYLGDIKTVGQYLAREQKRGADAKRAGMALKVWNMATQIPGFAMEFAITGGMGTVAKRGARKIVQKALKKQLKNKAAQLAIRGTGQTAKLGARIGGIGAGRIPGAIQKQQARGIKLDKDGYRYEDQGAAAFAKGVGDVAIEVGTESLGGPIGKVLGKVPGVKRLGELTGRGLGRLAGKLV